MSNSKDYYKMRYAQAGYTDPTDVEPQSIFDARAMEYGAGADSKVTTIKEDKKGTTETKTVTKDDGSKQTLTSFFPTIDPSLEEKVAKNLSERNILPSLNSPVTHPAGYANADNTMTMPVTPFGAKSASGKAMISDAGINLIAKDFEAKRQKRLANKKEADRISAMEKAMAPLSGPEVRKARNLPWWVRMEDANKGYGRQNVPPAAKEVFEDPRLEEIYGIGREYPEDIVRFDKNPELEVKLNREEIFDESMADKKVEKADESLINDDGTVDEKNQKKIWESEQIESEEKKIVSVPAAVKSIETLQAELKALENDPKLRRRKYLDFLRQNGVLKRWRPDLFKALAGTAFRLMMGDSAGDAFTYSFGRLQEQKDIAKEAQDKLDLEKAKAAGKGGGNIEYTKDAKRINIGTAQAPIEVRTTVGKTDGVAYFSYGGQNIKVDALKNSKVRTQLGLTPLNANHPNGYMESFTTPEVNEAITKNVGVLDGLIRSAINYGDLDKDDRAYVDSGLLATSQLYSAFDMLSEHGIDVGPNMDPTFMGMMSESAGDFMKYKAVKPDGNKSYPSFVKDKLVVADMSGIGLGPETYVAPPKIPGTKKDFKMNDSAFSELIENAVLFVNNAAANSNDERIKALQIGIVRNKIGFAHAAYQEYLKDPKNASEQGLKNIAKVNLAGYEAGYLPFHYWLREQTR